jgi:hypothetical protein
MRPAVASGSIFSAVKKQAIAVQPSAARTAKSRHLRTR